jgi:hypothetical protein
MSCEVILSISYMIPEGTGVWHLSNEDHNDVDEENGNEYVNGGVKLITSMIYQTIQDMNLNNSWIFKLTIWCTNGELNGTNVPFRHLSTHLDNVLCRHPGTKTKIWIKQNNDDIYCENLTR